MVFESESVLRYEERGRGKRAGARRTGEERKNRKPSGAAREGRGRSAEAACAPLVLTTTSSGAGALRTCTAECKQRTLESNADLVQNVSPVCLKRGRVLMRKKERERKSGGQERGDRRLGETRRQQAEAKDGTLDTV